MYNNNINVREHQRTNQCLWENQPFSVGYYIIIVTSAHSQILEEPIYLGTYLIFG